MKITKRQLKKMIQEAQWGNFTGGAAPLDEPMRDSGPIPKEELSIIADIFINDMGMTPKEVLQKAPFLDAGITDLAQLKEHRTLQERGTGNPALKQEEQAIRIAVQDFYDKYMMAMGANPSDPKDLERVKRAIHDNIDAVLGVI